MKLLKPKSEDLPPPKIEGTDLQKYEILFDHLEVHRSSNISKDTDSKRKEPDSDQQNLSDIKLKLQKLNKQIEALQQECTAN